MKERKIKTIDSLFGGDDFLENEDTNKVLAGAGEIASLPISSLFEYKNHPFKMYTGKRLDDMVNSIKENGVMTPIIVMPSDNGYMILSGHNRSKAAELAGLEEVPAIIKNDITDGEAKLIVTQTNFFQRSLTDMLPSEKAWAFKLELEGLKEERKAGARVSDIENSAKASDINGNTNGVQVEHPGKSRDSLARRYDVSGAEVQRYIRLTHLIPEIMDMVDEDSIAINAGVQISHLTINQQAEIVEALADKKYKVDIEKAELLKAYAKDNKLNMDVIKDILEGVISVPGASQKRRATPVTLKTKTLSKFFTMESNNQILNKVEKALELRELSIPNLLKKYSVETEDVEALTIAALETYLKGKSKK